MCFRIQFLNRSASRLASRVHIDHGRFEVGMSRYLLKCENVSSFVGQPCTERMAQIVKTKVLDLRFLYRTRETLLQINKSTTGLRAWCFVGLIEGRVAPTPYQKVVGNVKPLYPGLLEIARVLSI